MLKSKLLIFLGILVFLGAVAQAQSVNHPFFLAGDGRIKIRNQHNGLSLDAVYQTPDGKLDESVFLKIDRVFGFPTNLMGEGISRRTIAMLDYFSDRVAPGKTVGLVSGYRSQDYNNALRAKGKTAARTSTHIDGMAADFSIEGVNGTKFWDMVRGMKCCGIGYYYGDVVHLDSGRPRYWKTETSKVKTDASAFNRQMYLSAEYDRYQAGDKVRLLFTSVSDFGFGVEPQIKLVDEIKTEKVLDKTILDGVDTCKKIIKRKDARFLSMTLPTSLKPGRYRVQLDFCERPFEEMPKSSLSGPIEIVRP